MKSEPTAQLINVNGVRRRLSTLICCVGAQTRISFFLATQVTDCGFNPVVTLNDLFCSLVISLCVACVCDVSCFNVLICSVCFVRHVPYPNLYPDQSPSEEWSMEERFRPLTFHGLILRSQLVNLLIRGVCYAENQSVRLASLLH